MNATYSIWKPVDMVSYDIIKIARQTVALGTKIGHAGTLDPFAEGVLVLCFGDKTKEVSKIMAMEKEYIGKIKLGVETDTLDKLGDIYRKKNVPDINELNILNVFKKFKGKIHQVPPPFSALKLNGKCLYKYARLGIRIIKRPRIIEIFSLDIVDFNGFDTIMFKVLCSSGTYIRSLASDIAKELGTCGHLEELQRLRVGEYTKENSLTLEELKNGNIR